MYIMTIGVASLATEVMLVINRRRNPLCTKMALLFSWLEYVICNLETPVRIRLEPQ